jgi:hypothetical protein
MVLKNQGDKIFRKKNIFWGKESIALRVRNNARRRDNTTKYRRQYFETG